MGGLHHNTPHRGVPQNGGAGASDVLPEQIRQMCRTLGEAVVLHGNPMLSDKTLDREGFLVGKRGEDRRALTAVVGSEATRNGTLPARRR